VPPAQQLERRVVTASSDHVEKATRSVNTRTLRVAASGDSLGQRLPHCSTPRLTRATPASRSRSSRSAAACRRARTSVTGGGQRVAELRVAGSSCRADERTTPTGCNWRSPNHGRRRLHGARERGVSSDSRAPRASGQHPVARVGGEGRRPSPIALESPRRQPVTLKRLRPSWPTRRNSRRTCALAIQTRNRGGPPSDEIVGT